MNIFVSYSRKSRIVVETLAIDLEALGYEVWFDRDLAGGQDWWEEILRSIRRCQLFLYALTPESIESYPCKLEYEYAIALNKRILPVMLTDIDISSLSFSLQKLQIIDYRLQDKQQALALGRALNCLPKTRPLPKPLPPKPESPIPPLTRLRAQIEAASLEMDEQDSIVARLKEFLESSVTEEEACSLLRQLRTRDDLLAKTEKEINRLLGSKKSTEVHKRKIPITALPRIFAGHTEAVFGVAYAPDGQTILTAGADKLAIQWDVMTGDDVCRLVGHTGTIWNVTYAPDSHTAVTSSRDRTIRLWDLTTGAEVYQFTGHQDSVWGLAYAPDGQTIVTGSFDKTARLWDVATGQEIRSFIGHAAAVWGVAFAPDGCTVLTGSWDRTIRLWDVATGKEIRRFIGHTSPVFGVAYSPDGRIILSSCRDAYAKLWDVQTGQELCELTGHIAFGIAYSPDNRVILTGGADKTVGLWEAKTGHELYRFNGHTDAVTGIAFSPQSNAILTGSVDKTVRLWDIKVDKQPVGKDIFTTNPGPLNTHLQQRARSVS